MSLQRIAIVTGAAQGLGRSIAIRLAQDGQDVTVSDISSKIPRLEEVATEIRRLGRKALVVGADISVEKQVEYLVSQTVKELGGLDVMVANAGIVSLAPFLETSAQELERLYRVNVQGTMLCFRNAAKVMVEQGRGGRLIAASSVLGKMGLPMYSAYSASKFAIRGLTQVAAAELGAFGITANVYAPGAINTEMLLFCGDRTSSLLKIDKSEHDAGIKQGTAVKRLGEPEDISNVVSFLASKDSAYITGQSISVDGGLRFD